MTKYQNQRFADEAVGDDGGGQWTTAHVTKYCRDDVPPAHAHPRVLGGKVNKPMMSTVVEVVDEGLGEDFEDTPWVPPTVKRVSFEAG